jgi:ribosomal protein L40E
MELASLALTSEEKLVLLAVLAVVMILVLYFELRVMRGKAKEVRRAIQNRDEAYNSILTTRAVMNTVTNQGKSTGRAAIYIERAEEARRRGDYATCLDLCEKAKAEITIPTRSSATGKDEAALENVAEEVLSSGAKAQAEDTYSGTKLTGATDGNYMSAKFAIAAARGDIGQASRKGISTAAAEGMLADAESAFSSGNFNRALSIAVRARKSVASEGSVETIPLKPEAAPKPPKAAAPEPGIADEAVPQERMCVSCGANLEPEDAFCPICGAKVQRERICQSCGARPGPGDKFCRKCGAKLD